MVRLIENNLFTFSVLSLRWLLGALILISSGLLAFCISNPF